MNDEHDSGNLLSALLDMLALPTRSVYSGTRNLLRGDLKGAIPLGVGLGSGLATLASGGGAGLAGLIGAIGGGAFQGLGEAIDPERMKVGQLADVIHHDKPVGTESLPMALELLAGGLASPLAFSGGPLLGRAAGRGLAGLAGRAGGGALSSKLAGMMQGPMGLAEKVGDKFDDLSNWLNQPRKSTSAINKKTPFDLEPQGNNGTIPNVDPLSKMDRMWQDYYYKYDGYGWRDPWAEPPPLSRPAPPVDMGLLPEAASPVFAGPPKGGLGLMSESAALPPRPTPPMSLGLGNEAASPVFAGPPRGGLGLMNEQAGLGGQQAAVEKLLASLSPTGGGPLATLPQASRPMSVGSSWQKSLDDALKGRNPLDEIIDAEFTVRGPMRSLPAPPKSTGASLQEAYEQAKGLAEPMPAAARSTMPGSSWKEAAREAKMPKGVERKADRIAMIREAAEKRKASKGYKTFKEDTQELQSKVEIKGKSGQSVNDILGQMVNDVNSPREMENLLVVLGQSFKSFDPDMKQNVAATMQRLIQQWGLTKRVPNDYMRELLGSVQPLFKSKRG